MPKKLSDVIAEIKAAPPPRWTTEQLMAVRHLGPALIGEEMYAAAQAVANQTGDGRFGPALLGIIPDSYRDQRELKKDDAA